MWSLSFKRCSFILTSSVAGFDWWQCDWRLLVTKDWTGSLSSLSLMSPGSCLAKNLEVIELRWLGYRRSVTSLVFHISAFNSFTTDLSVCSLNLSKLVCRGICSEIFFNLIKEAFKKAYRLMSSPVPTPTHCNPVQTQISTKGTAISNWQCTEQASNIFNKDIFSTKLI